MAYRQLHYRQTVTLQTDNYITNQNFEVTVQQGLFFFLNKSLSKAEAKDSFSKEHKFPLFQT